VEEGSKITIGVNAASQQQEAAAVLIKGELSKLGITASIRKDPEAVYTDQRFKGGYDAWLDEDANAFVDSPYYYLFIFYRSDIYCCNFQQYANPKVDELTDELATTVDEDRIRTLWREAVGEIVADAPSAFILDRNWVIATRDDIGGIVAEPDGLLSYRELERR
jgi:ABC-type transport system substrate-binding protein